MRVVHLYPFSPRGRHGGTLRLSAAVDATSELGEPEIHYFDADADAWSGPVEAGSLAGMLEEVPSDPPRGSVGLKRRLFPSTLWESGRHPCRALTEAAQRFGIDDQTVLFLHTSYLAPSLPSLPPARARIVDVYDLVWAAHRNDATAARGPARALRLAYAATVRRREEAAVARADGLVAAGFADAAALGAPWIPTPTPLGTVPEARPSGEVLRVGLLGNYAHVSTRLSLESVMRSGIASDPSIRLIVAGLHARQLVRGGERVEVLGEVPRAEDFYAGIDCVVAPVLGGSGIKCKLAEGILAGRPVITTELGAAGYPPELRPSFSVCEPGELDRSAIDRAVADMDADAARERFERVLGTEAVIKAYGAALSTVLERSG